MLRASSGFAITILMTILGGCALDPAVNPRELEAQRDVAERGRMEDLESTPEVGGAEQASTVGASAQAVQAAAAGCSVVVSCNAPGPEGTRCRQQGCSLGAARLECALESVAVCGAAVCPVILVELDGTRENLCGAGA
jgi:hypothetical protein